MWQTIVYSSGLNNYLLMQMAASRNSASRKSMPISWQSKGQQLPPRPSTRKAFRSWCVNSRRSSKCWQPSRTTAVRWYCTQTPPSCRAHVPPGLPGASWAGATACTVALLATLFPSLHHPSLYLKAPFGGKDAPPEENCSDLNCILHSRDILATRLSDATILLHFVIGVWSNLGQGPTLTTCRTRDQ